MSIIENQTDGFGKYKDSKVMSVTSDEIIQGKYERSQYKPNDEDKEVIAMVLRHFVLGHMNMWTPRVEFNDLAVIQRMQTDQMSWNTYQPNNGQSASEDNITGWRSNAMRPIVRNKCVSIAAHATARLIFPKIFAYNESNDEENDGAQVMMDLMEWAADKSNYAHTSLYRVITALTDPASIGYTEYGEVYRSVKRAKVNGTYQIETMLDETLSGFQDHVVPVDELYIENFYEPDIQKQGWLLWRRVISFDLAQAKYGSLYPNFNKYVKPGVQTVYSDANQSFYFVYDPNMRQYEVEEVLYWNKNMDVKLIMVNGVLLTDYDNPNPRIDKMYPFDKFGYEIINNRCFYYKSLAFKMMQDANIINTLYPMIIDGTYLNLMPPMINTGSEAIGSDVIVPGSVTTLSDPNAKLTAVKVATDLKSGMDTLFKVDESINESSQDPIENGQPSSGSQTAYEISRLEQNAATVLGLFIKMIAKHVKDFGKLRMSDILQYLTIADVNQIAANKPLVFKTFLMKDKQSNGRSKTRKIQFDMNTPDEMMTGKEMLNQSYDILREEGGINSKTEIYKVNPELFRNLTYMVMVSPDVLNPRSEDLERAYDLESYDKMILNPLADQEETYRLLLSTNTKTKKDPDKYISQQQQMPQNPQDQLMQQVQGGPKKPASPTSPTLPQIPTSAGI